MHSVNARELMAQVRERTLDTNGRVWVDAEVLGAADSMLRSIYGRYRQSGASHGIDRVDVLLTAFTQVATNVYEYQLPEYVGDVHGLEGIASSATRPVQIPLAPFEEKDLALGTFNLSHGACWIFSKSQNPGSIQVIGNMGGIPTVRIWFIRNWGPLHYAVASAGSTTAITVGTASSNYKKRDGLYVGMQFEVTSDSGQAANVAALRRVNTFASGVLGFDALPAAASTTTNYAMVIPLPAEDHEYLVQLVAVQLLQRGGDEDALRRHVGWLQKLEADFNSAIKMRTSSEPIRLYSSRGRGW